MPGNPTSVSKGQNIRKTSKKRSNYDSSATHTSSEAHVPSSNSEYRVNEATMTEGMDAMSPKNCMLPALSIEDLSLSVKNGPHK